MRKCFDQIQRCLVYALLKEAGLPDEIIETYQDMLEHLVVVNNISGHAGEEHQHPCGLPQGDPWSMAIVALLFRPSPRQKK